MHDPMVVAFSIPSPIPRRSRWRDAGPTKTSVRRDKSKRPVRRWGWTRSRRTNDANLGEPTYRWWRLRGWGPLRIAGRAFGLDELVCVWHVEPGGRDSGEVCRHTYGSHESSPPWPAPWKVRWLPWYKLHPALPADPESSIYPNGHDAWVLSHAWKFHVHHWHVTFRPEQRLRRRIECCTLCHRPYRRRDAVISHQWDTPPARWRDWLRTRRRVPRAYHRECSALVDLRNRHERNMLALDRIAPTREQLHDLGLPHTPTFNVLYDLDNWRKRVEDEWQKLPPADRLTLGTRPASSLYGRDLSLVLHNALPVTRPTP